MAWNRFRATGPNDESHRRRHSIIGSSHISGQCEDLSHPEPTLQLTPTQSAGSDTQARNSVIGLDAADVSHQTNINPSSPKRTRLQRFSLLKSRHASDSQLSKTAKEQASAADIPPVPPTPSILKTAPTQELNSNPKTDKTTHSTLPFRRKGLAPPTPFSAKPSRKSSSERALNLPEGGLELRPSNQGQRISQLTFEEPDKTREALAPPAYGDDSNSALALPVSRLSESSRSDGSSGDHGMYATTTTTHTVSTTTTFFRLPRRKNKGPLFPLPAKVQSSEPSPLNPGTPRASTSGRPSSSQTHRSGARTPPATAIHRPFNFGHPNDGGPPPLPSPSHAALAASSINFAAPGTTTLRRESTASSPSRSSSRASPVRTDGRGRTSTMGSRQVSEDGRLGTPPAGLSTRTSTSTAGRASLGGLFNLSRLRQSSEPPFIRGSTPHLGTPANRSSGSNPNSMSLSREAPVVPERQEGDTPAKYLARLEEAVSRGIAATILSKSEDEFSKNVLRSYMRGFKFFEDPLDMAIRKLLMEVELPKETQQIDRVLQSFADRYHECNPGIFASSDEAYFIAFSILILHTDVFNRNNKHKMQKNDYTKNARGQGVADEILECFYDNISYTPFIRVEDEIDINGERIVTRKPKKGIFKTGTSAESLRRNSKEPVDPYTLIMDKKLDSLRPTFKELLNLDDPFNYLGTAKLLNVSEIHRTFFKFGVLQIMSSRSRPDAFKTQATITNPAEAQAGVVDIKVTKVGILWRKDQKKKKTRSPWQEWGAILTGSQLYLFRNISWIKNLMHQYELHHKQAPPGTSVIFKPPLENLKPDHQLSTEDVVALLDSHYRKHKHAFVFVRHSGFEETLLAENESEMNDWLAKLNYAASFRTAGVRMRNLISGSSESQTSRGAIRPIESSASSPSASTQSMKESMGEVSNQSGSIDNVLVQQILVARRQIINQKIEEANEKLAVLKKQLDVQLRNARHIQILAPIQNKTREQLENGAPHMAAQIRWTRMEMWRTRCHKDILAMDIEEEDKPIKDRDAQIDDQTVTATSTVPQQTPIREGLTRLTSQMKSVVTPQVSPRSTRPTTQPSGVKTFSMDDIFQTPPRTLSHRAIHRPQSSWEIPPLSFEGEISPTSVGPIDILGLPPTTDGSLGSSPKKVETRTSWKNMAASLANPSTSLGDDGGEILKQAGLVDDESSLPEARRPDTASDSEKARSRDREAAEGRSKVRRSLHKTLRDAHVPNHHRGKKGKDSASSAAATEDESPLADTERLARGTGSFTVHGKKASVVNFGSEWQNVSPEERLKLRKQAAVLDESRLSVPSAIDDDAVSLKSTSARGRPTSMTSRSTSTTMSFQGGDLNGSRPPPSPVEASAGEPS